MQTTTAIAGSLQSTGHQHELESGAFTTCESMACTRWEGGTLVSLRSAPSSRRVLTCSETTPKVRMPNQMRPPASPNLRSKTCSRICSSQRGMPEAASRCCSTEIVTFSSSCWLSSLWSLLGAAGLSLVTLLLPAPSLLSRLLDRLLPYRPFVSPDVELGYVWGLSKMAVCNDSSGHAAAHDDTGQVVQQRLLLRCPSLSSRKIHSCTCRLLLAFKRP